MEHPRSNCNILIALLLLGTVCASSDAASSDAASSDAASYDAASSDAASSDAAPDGFLAGTVPATGAHGPLRDTQGHWYLLPGIPVNPRPFTDKSTTVAVIDSGVLVDHPQLKGLIAEQRDFTGEGPADRTGHGTVVTILTLSARASLPSDLQAKLDSPRIIVAKVAYDNYKVRHDAVIKAIQWAVQRGAKVVNLSLGLKQDRGICDLIAKNSRIMFTAAAGNDGPSVRVYPAACRSENLLSVAATDPNGNLAVYSGPGDIAAPGTAILVPSNLGP